MPISYLFLVLLVLSVFGFYLGRGRAMAIAGGYSGKLHSRPSYHGLYVAIWCGLPSFVLLLLWFLLQSRISGWLLLSALEVDPDSLSPEDFVRLSGQVVRVAAGTLSADGLPQAVIDAAERYSDFQSIAAGALAAFVLALSVGGLAVARRKISIDHRARQGVERAFNWIMIAASTIAILTTLGLVLSLLFEALRFFARVSPIEFFFGLHWSPQTALRADQVGASGSFGAIPLFAGTALITLIAMATAVPIGLLSAMYLSEYASPRFRAWVKPALEILAGIPTVVYGFFAALRLRPSFAVQVNP